MTQELRIPLTDIIGYYSRTNLVPCHLLSVSLFRFVESKEDKYSSDDMSISNDEKINTSDMDLWISTCDAFSAYLRTPTFTAFNLLALKYRLDVHANLTRKIPEFLRNNLITASENIRLGFIITTARASKSDKLSDSEIDSGVMNGLVITLSEARVETYSGLCDDIVSRAWLVPYMKQRYHIKIDFNQMVFNCGFYPYTYNTLPKLSYSKAKLDNTWVKLLLTALPSKNFPYAPITEPVSKTAYYIGKASLSLNMPNSSSDHVVVKTVKYNCGIWASSLKRLPRSFVLRWSASEDLASTVNLISSIVTSDHLKITAQDVTVIQLNLESAVLPVGMMVKSFKKTFTDGILECIKKFNIEKVVKVVVVAGKGSGKSTIIRSIRSAYGSGPFIEDSDDFGCFLTYAMIHSNFKDLDDMNNASTKPSDVLALALAFVKQLYLDPDATRTAYPSFFNQCAAGSIRNMLDGKIFYHEGYLDSILRDSDYMIGLRQMITFFEQHSVFNQKTFEDAIYLLLAEQQIPMYLFMCHTQRDTAKRRPADIMLNYQSNTVPHINIVDRAHRAKTGELPDIIGELALATIYDESYNASTISVSYGQLFEILGIRFTIDVDTSKMSIVSDDEIFNMLTMGKSATNEVT